ncbi:MAG: carbohydrate kinase family protein [Thermomicrobiales bacterium]|nr:carbohydrate kinase family protein [Thermomicrobiales bacterium]
MSDAPLAIVGNLNLDLWVGPVERFPRTDEELLADSARLELAGSAGYMLQAALALGIEPRVVSTIGDDAFGDVLRHEMARLGATVRGVETLPGEETSLGIIFVAPDGSRAILSTLGAHKAMDPVVARRHDAFVADCPAAILCGAYLLPRFGPDAIRPYAEHLRRRGQLVAFDPSWDPAGWGEATRTATFRLLPAVDVYLPNEFELLALTGRDSLEEAVVEAAAVAGEVVVKRGAAGALYARGDERIAAPAPPVAVSNTIGAGDVFDVGYLYARRRGDAPRERLCFANALAGLVISQPGRRTYPSVGEVETAMRRAACAGEEAPA